MDITLKYELSASLLVEGHKRIIRTRYMLVRVFCCLLALGGLAILGFTKHWHILGGFYLVLGPSCWAVLEAQFRRMASHQLVSFHGPAETHISAAGVRQHFQFLTSNIGWELVSSALETDRLWLLKINSMQAIHLPKAAFKPEDAEAFRAFLAHRHWVTP